MKNFRRVMEQVDVERILEELELAPEAWHAQTGNEIPAQRETESIPIRGLRKTGLGDRRRRPVHESRYTRLSRSFLSVVAFIEAFADERNARLGRAKLVRLPAGSKLLPRRDPGDYPAPRDRYHLVLKGPGSWMRCGDEEVTMREGELWWFDHQQEHEARNDSEADRIHLIFDLEPLPEEPREVHWA